MLQNIKTPMGKMSYVGDVHLDTDMKGKHYDLVALGDDNGFDHVAMAILTDLMQEDPRNLTTEEFYYYFMVVKLASVGPKLKVNITCTNKIPSADGKTSEPCNHQQQVEVGLNEADVIYLPKSFEIPEIELKVDGKMQTYQIKPIKMIDEIDLLNTYLEQGVTRKEIVNPEKANQFSLAYSKDRLALSLTNKDINEHPFTDRELRAKFIKDLMEENSFSKLVELKDKFAEYFKYGVSHKLYITQCERCGRKLVFRLPLQAGLPL